MIKLAMKNSLIETQSNEALLDGIEEMKTFYPTEEEFKLNPIEYIETLFRQGAD